MRPATKLFFVILAGTAAIIIYLNLYTTSPLPNSPAFFKINRLTGSTQLCVPSIEGVRCRSRVEIEQAREADRVSDDNRLVPQQQGTSKLAPAFFKANPWIYDPVYVNARNRLGEIDRALSNEGKLDKDKPEYFAELTRRFNREWPGLVRGLDGKLVKNCENVRGDPRVTGCP
jgi:hypothetical protein